MVSHRIQLTRRFKSPTEDHNYGFKRATRICATLNKSKRKYNNNTQENNSVVIGLFEKAQDEIYEYLTITKYNKL